MKSKNWQRAHAVWCLSSKNRLKCFVTVIKSNQHFNCQTFPFLAGTKLHVHGVYCASPIKTTEAFEYSYDDVEIKSQPKGAQKVATVGVHKKYYVSQ